MLKRMTSKNLLLMSATLLWLFLALFAMTRLWKFEGTAGKSGHPPMQWQRSIPMALDPARPTLIMLVHPQCPCSRASLTELNHLAALCPNQAAISVLFLKPAGYPQAWADTDLWRQAAAIPGVTVRADDNGETARRFGAATSGETVLYAPNGQLLYQGGLTGARGHEGDNVGLSAVTALLRGQIKTSGQEPVYGCPLTADRMAADRTGPDGQKISFGGLSWLP